MKQSYSIPIRARALLLLFFILGTAAFAQRKVTGKVVDSEAQIGIPGVTVLVKGSSKGTATDANGNFSLDIPQNGGTIVFSSIGYETREEEIGNRSEINVSLNSDTKALNEVVVTGYAS